MNLVNLELMRLSMLEARSKKQEEEGEEKLTNEVKSR